MRISLVWSALATMALVLASCASSETRSLVSKSDLPTTRYHKIVVFLEEPNPTAPSTPASAGFANGQLVITLPSDGPSASRAEMEQKILAALTDSGIAAKSGSALFKGKRISAQEKARVVQKEFDAILYVTILANGMRERLVEGAFHDGRMISIHGEVKEIDVYVNNAYELKADGTVYERVPTLHIKAELQDTKTAKLVWASETIATGGTLVLADKAIKQIAEKMRADGAI